VFFEEGGPFKCYDAWTFDLKKIALCIGRLNKMFSSSCLLSSVAFCVGHRKQNTRSRIKPWKVKRMGENVPKE
jgi:hypothetical protein